MVMTLFEFSYLIDSIVYVCKYIPFLGKEMLSYLFFKKGEKQTPEQVDENLFDYKASDIFSFVVSYMLQNSPFEIDKSCVHVITGSESIYKSFHDQLSCCQMHRISDSGHHLCYWNFENVAEVIKKI